VQVLTAAQSTAEIVPSVPFVGCAVMAKVRLLSSASAPVSATVTAVSSFVVAGLGVAEAVGALFGARTMVRQAENSEVLLVAALVAVAVTTSPTVVVAASVVLIVALPEPSVVTFWKPRKVRPSPLPEASHEALLKNSMRKAELALLLSVPARLVLAPDFSAEVMTGKFWRPFGPVSVSPGSLSVTPSPLMSIPSEPLEWIEFESRALPVPPVKKRTPRPVLKAMMFALAPLPPMRLFAAFETM
jgi:hypothetical protein